MNNVRTVNDLMNTAAQAMRDRDIETLDQLKTCAVNWLQSRDERDAQLNLLDSMMEACVDLEQ